MFKLILNHASELIWIDVYLDPHTQKKEKSKSKVSPFNWQSGNTTRV